MGLEDDTRRVVLEDYSLTSSFSLFLKNFLNDPFTTLNNLDLQYFGLQFNILKDDAKLRKALFTIFFCVPLIAWVLLGSDSTIDQVQTLFFNVPLFLLGKVSFSYMIQQYEWWYGLGTHWSASVIYSGLFIGTSKYLRDKLKSKNSENLCITAGVVGLSIATFEFFWMGSYYVFQNQPWILSSGWPQIRIIIQDLLFGLIGIFVLIDILSPKAKVKLNWNWKTWLFASITLGLVLLWWNYGFYFPVQQINVQTDYGLWTSSIHFPQTMYTVALHPTISAIGDLYYVANSGIHLVNNLCKIFWTLTFYSLFQLKRKRQPFGQNN